MADFEGQPSQSETLVRNLKEVSESVGRSKGSVCLLVAKSGCVLVTGAQGNNHQIKNKIKKLPINPQTQMPINSKIQTSKTMAVTSMLGLPSVVVTSGAGNENSRSSRLKN